MELTSSLGNSSLTCIILGKDTLSPWESQFFYLDDHKLFKLSVLEFLQQKAIGFFPPLRHSLFISHLLAPCLFSMISHRLNKYWLNYKSFQFYLFGWRFETTHVVVCFFFPLLFFCLSCFSPTLLRNN